MVLQEPSFPPLTALFDAQVSVELPLRISETPPLLRLRVVCLDNDRSRPSDFDASAICESTESTELLSILSIAPRSIQASIQLIFVYIFVYIYIMYK